MSAFPSARLRAVGTRSLKPVLTLSLAALLAACSSTKHPAGPQVFAWLAPEPQAMAPVAPVEVELEDDGLPVQAPPSTAIRQLPDDPTAPWSRNYGRSAAGVADGGRPMEAEPDMAPVAEPVNGDEGLPLPKSPEEAGVLPSEPRRMRGAALATPWATCVSGGRWKCAR